MQEISLKLLQLDEEKRREREREMGERDGRVSGRKKS